MKNVERFTKVCESLKLTGEYSYLKKLYGDFLADFATSVLFFSIFIIIFMHSSITHIIISHYETKILFLICVLYVIFEVQKHVT